MTDKTSSDTISSAIELANNVIDSNPVESYMNIIKKTFYENKMYFYIGIVILVLGVVLFYFYMKNKKETQSENKPKLDLPKQNQTNGQINEQINGQTNDLTNSQTNSQTNGQVPQINGDEYWVLDSNGNPIKVSGKFQQNGITNQLAPLPIPKQTPSAAEIKMLQQQMIEQQLLEQQMEYQRRLLFEQQQAKQNKQTNQTKQPNQQTKHVLTHPEDSDEVVSDNIDLELARIKANEDENVAQHDLTNSELAEISKKLELMGNQMSNQMVNN